jgi:3-hydroxyisobutyrate dehydrogenase
VDVVGEHPEEQAKHDGSRTRLAAVPITRFVIVRGGNFQRMGSANRERVVAVLGAGGTMGFAMAQNLLAAGFRLQAWNRTFEKAEPLAAAGAELSESPAAAVDRADTILTAVSDVNAVIATMDGGGALSAAEDGALWLQMSTIGEDGTARCAELARGHGLGFVDAPVLGTKQPAEQGELVVLASGADGLQESAEPIFGAVGKKTLWVGEAGAGTRLKLVANTWILAVLEGGAEAIALAEGLGVDPSLLFEAIEDGPLDMGYLRAKGRAMIERDFTPSFSLRLAAKDAGLVEESAGRRGMELPLLAAVRRQLDSGVDEHGDEDMSATFLASAPRATAGRA